MRIADISNRTRLGIAACVLILGLGIGDLVRPTCGTSVPPVPFPDGQTPPVTYALTPYDFGVLVRAGREGPVGRIAALPSKGFPDGPVLTRTSQPTHRVMPGTQEKLSLTRLPGGWTQVNWGDSSAKRGSEGPLSLRSASVYLKRDGSRRSCTQVGIDRYRCSDKGWGFVGPNTLTISGRKETCVWAHPLKGATTLISYGSTDPAEFDDLHLWTALDDGVATAGGPVEITAHWGDARTDITHPAEPGWEKTPLNRPDAAASLELSVRAERVGQRHFCYRFSTGAPR